MTADAAGGRGGGGVAALLGRRPETVLRRGTAAQADLLPHHLAALPHELAGYLGPSPEHPYYAGFTVLAARGGVVAVHEARGRALRYADYDAAAGRGVELPAARQLDAAPDTVYDLASCTKLCTAVVAVSELERGRLEADAPVARYLPEYARAGKRHVTVRQLLTHTSGLAPELPFHAAPDAAARRELLLAEAPRQEPGTAYGYSDLNMITLQWVLERITGRPLDVLVRERITAPLGMAATRFVPPPSWRPRIAATEVQRRPWARVDRGLVWGEVHDENAWAFGGVSGHAGLFSTARDLAVLGQTLLNGGVYSGRRILSASSVALLLGGGDRPAAGGDHGLGFELCRRWYMGALATPFTAGHTGFTGTSLVLDPTTGTLLVLLSNSVHPCRDWRAGSAPRAAAGTRLARAVPVRPPRQAPSWSCLTGDEAEAAEPVGAVLALPELRLPGGGYRLEFDVWFDTVPGAQECRLEASAGAGAFAAVPFAADGTVRPDGVLTGFGGRRWQRACADLSALGPGPVELRWRAVHAGPYTGRGVYVSAPSVRSACHVLFDAAHRADAARVRPHGWAAARD